MIWRGSSAGRRSSRDPCRSVHAAGRSSAPRSRGLRVAAPTTTQGRDGEHAAGNGDRRDQDVPGRQPAANHDEGRGRRGDHPAGQQRPAGQRRVGALPGEAAEGEGRGQLGSGQRNRDRQGVGRIGGGQHGPEAHAGAAGGEQPAQHDREGGHGRRFERDGGRYPEPVQMTQHRERRGHRGPLGHPSGRQCRHRDSGGHGAGHALTVRALRRCRDVRGCGGADAACRRRRGPVRRARADAGLVTVMSACLGWPRGPPERQPAGRGLVRVW